MKNQYYLFPQCPPMTWLTSEPPKGYDWAPADDMTGKNSRSLPTAERKCSAKDEGLQKPPDMRIPCYVTV